MWRLGRWIAAVSSILLLAGLIGPAPIGPAPAWAAPEPDPGAGFGHPPAWGSCAQFGAAAAAVPGAQCGYVAVPVDWADPAGAQAQLAVLRVPATGAKIGALLVNPGGPGGSAVNTVVGMARALAGTDVARHFDLVGFDPRGVGHSTPELRCRTDAEFDAHRREPMADYSPAGVAHIEALHRQFAQQCLDRNGAAFLAGLGTADAARDMDVVRAALGEQQINYLGFSYGTKLGAAYAEQFGDRIRTMVLDGAVDPSLGPLAGTVEQMAGFQSAFNEYAADCAQSAGCPLGTDPAQWVNRFHHLVNPLVQQPAVVSDPRGLSYQDAITGTVQALYSRQYWKYLTSGLLGLQRGTDAVDLLLLADEYQRRDRNGHYQNQQDAFTAIRCVDAPYPTDPAVWAENDRRIREVAPFLAYGEFTGFAPRNVCTMWPVPPTTTPHPASSPGPDKVVVVSTTGDPATPHQAGVALAHQMDAALITFDGTQHTVVFNGDPCVDSAVLRFLIDGVPPPDGLRC